MISLLINSWKRPDNIYKIIETQKDYDLIREIIIFNNNKDVTLSHPHSKVKIVNCNTDFGLRTRWANGLLASEDCLVFQDDDLIAKPEAFSRLWQNFLKDPKRVYCAWGRNLDPQGRYSLKNCYGEVDICLTCLASIPKELIGFLVESERLFFKANSLEYSDINKWGYHGDMNGEDIFLAYASLFTYNNKPMQIDLPVRHLQSSDALHKRSGHREARNNMVNKCEEFFSSNKTSQKDMIDFLQLARNLK
tara:strand:+ start:83 stop:829 length:747 start_codon:yes stop_codon:yes gene_type:complete